MICMNHYDGEVWGLACHPKQPLFVTCGGDCTIRIWNAIEGTITDKYDSPEDMRACDWSKDGSMIVVASVSRTLMLFDDGLNILSEYQSQLYKRKDQFVEDIKFNPSGTMIAYGVQGGAAPIEIVRIDNKTLKPHKQPIIIVKPHLSISAGINDSLLHLDWSVDGVYLALNSLRDEIKFVNIVSQEVVKSSNAKDIIWETWTSKFGYQVQGIFPGANSRDVNTVSRSKHQRVLATGDDFQNVNLFRYPSVLDPKSGMLTSGSKRYVGHSSNVQRVRFMMDDNCLVSVGGADKTILVWATDFGSHPKEAWRDFFDGMNIDFDRTETVTGVQPKIPRDHKGNVIVSSINTNNLYQYKKSDFMMEEVDDGNELSKPEPWREIIKPPTVTSGSGGDYAMAPDISLSLDFCHGYRVKDKRNNLFYVNDGDLAYFAGGLGIVHKRPSKSPIPSQKFFDKHRDDCISMAVHPNKKVIATGELGPRPYIYIWDAATCQQLAVAKDALLRGVEHLAFSPDGACLLAVCNDLEHKFVIFSTDDYRYLLFLLYPP